MIGLNSFATLSVLLFGSVVAYPDHAECKVKYKIPLECGQVKQMILDQMQVWDTNAECPGNCEKVKQRRGVPLVRVNLEGIETECTGCPFGQKCLYRLTNTTENTITGRQKPKEVTCARRVELQDRERACSSRGARPTSLS